MCRLEYRPFALAGSLLNQAAYRKTLLMLCFIGNVDQEWDNTRVPGHYAHDAVDAEMHSLDHHALLPLLAICNEPPDPFHDWLTLRLVSLNSQACLLSHWGC